MHCILQIQQCWRIKGTNWEDVCSHPSTHRDRHSAHICLFQGHLTLMANISNTCTNYTCTINSSLCVYQISTSNTLCMHIFLYIKHVNILHILHFLYFMLWTSVFIFCVYDFWGYSVLKMVMIVMNLKAPVNQKQQDPTVLNCTNGDRS